MDERSIVLYLNRKGLTPQGIHYDLVATLGEEALIMGSYSPRKFHLTSTTRMRLFREPLNNSHSLQFGSFHVQHIYPKPRQTGDSLRHSGLQCVISDGCYVPV
jgi:hypothetical protein